MNLLFPLLAVLLAACWVSLRKPPIRFTPTDFRFRERYGDWAIVAGASGTGLGAAWADALCELHMNVLLIARREPELLALKKTLQEKHSGIQVDTLIQDLGDDRIDQIFAKILANRDRKYGFLVHNAGYIKLGHFLDVSMEQHNLHVDVNIRSVLTMTHQFGNYLQVNDQTGGIIIMSSFSGYIGTPFLSSYAGTKGWDTTFAQSISSELRPIGIDVLACVSGPILTPGYLNLVGANRNPIMEQTPQAVAEECLQSIGTRSTVRTGVMTKLVSFFMIRMLPVEMAIQASGREVEKMVMNQRKDP